MNLSIDTLAVSDWPARGIVALYMAAVCTLAAGLQARGLVLRFA